MLSRDSTHKTESVQSVFISGKILLLRDSQNIVFNFHLPSRKLRFDTLLQFRHGRRAVLAVEAAGVVHEDDVALHAMPQDGIELAGEPLPVALQSGPAVISGVQPEQRGRSNGLEQ